MKKKYWFLTCLEIWHIFFFHGLVFIILAAVCLTLLKAENRRLP